MPGSFLELNRKLLHVCSVTLQYNVQNLCEKTDHYEANEKKKNEESFKLFTKPRREMAITIKKKKIRQNFF